MTAPQPALIALRSAGLKDSDVVLVRERWQDPDWAKHPGLQHLGEHMKAYVDRLRGEAI